MNVWKQTYIYIRASAGGIMSLGATYHEIRSYEYIIVSGNLRSLLSSKKKIEESHIKAYKKMRALGIPRINEISLIQRCHRFVSQDRCDITYSKMSSIGLIGKSSSWHKGFEYMSHVLDLIIHLSTFPDVSGDIYSY